jgi:hypothetical protein
MSLPRRSFPLARVAAIAMLAVLLPAAALHAQQEERPVTFDSAQRMTAITPMLAARLKLQAPAWPVTGEFREARLYAIGDGRVLVVQRQDGTLVRYPLDAAAAQALQGAVEAGMRISGNPAGEPNAYVYSEVAGTRYARGQLWYGLLLYGPLLATFADDGNAASALYLTGAAMPSLLALGFAHDGVLTRAQTDLGSDATLRWAMLGSFAHRAIAGDDDGDSHAGTVLGAALLGTASGLAIGRSLTDGEGESMIAGSNYLLGITASTMFSMGAFEKRHTLDPFLGDVRRSGVSQGEWGTLLAAGVVGYPLGLAYARRSAYTVTAGDANALMVPATLGALTALAVVGENSSDRATWGAVTGGLVLGLAAGDRLLVKPFDYTRSQATALKVGAIGGGVAGLIPATLAKSDDSRPYVAGAAIGAALGATFAHHMVNPRRGLGREVLRDASRAWPSDRGLAAGATGSSGAARATAAEPRVQWQLDPAGLAMAAARAPGRHGILSLTF